MKQKRNVKSKKKKTTILLKLLFSTTGKQCEIWYCVNGKRNVSLIIFFLGDLFGYLVMKNHHQIIY